MGANRETMLRLNGLAWEEKRKRYAILSAVGEGTMTMREALDDERSERITVMQLLMAQRRWGVGRSAALLRRMAFAGEPISETRRIGDLTDRQRDVLARWIEGGR